jgi:hypothetical protein
MVHNKPAHDSDHDHDSTATGEDDSPTESERPVASSPPREETPRRPSAPTAAPSEAALRELERKLSKREKDARRKEREQKQHDEELSAEFDTLRFRLERKNRELHAKDLVIDEMRVRIEQLEQALMVNSIRTTAAAQAAGKPRRAVIVRTLQMTDGGTKCFVPTTNAELVALAGHELRVSGIALRRLNYLRVDVSELADGDTIYVSTEADEKRLSILGL